MSDEIDIVKEKIMKELNESLYIPSYIFSDKDKHNYLMSLQIKIKHLEMTQSKIDELLEKYHIIYPEEFQTEYAKYLLEVVSMQIAILDYHKIP